MNKFQQIDSELKHLFESENSDGIVFNITSQSLLSPIQPSNLFDHCIDPLTGTYYDGIYLLGEFASIGVLNNNNRIYTKENYLDLLGLLREQIHTIGVYGELEHPDKYASDSNNYSHKIVDIWYDESTDKVMGIIVLLDTEKGRIAQQVVRSGGKLALSARAGGKEIKNMDGSITANLRLLVTFDIVANPGFSTARQEYLGDIFSEEINNISIFNPQSKKVIEIENLTPINESVLNESAIQQFDDGIMFQNQQDSDKGTSQNQQNKEAEILQEGDKKQQQEYQKKLQKQVQQTLNEGFDLIKQKILKPNRNGALFEQPYLMDNNPEVVSNVFGNLSQNETEFEIETDLILQESDSDFEEFLNQL